MSFHGSVTVSRRCYRFITLGPSAAQTQLDPASRAERGAREFTEPADELESGSGQQPFQFLRKDAPQDQRDDPRIPSVGRRNVPGRVVDLGRGVVVVCLFHKEWTEALGAHLHDGKALAARPRQPPEIGIEDIEGEDAICSEMTSDG